MRLVPSERPHPGLSWALAGPCQLVAPPLLARVCLVKWPTWPAVTHWRNAGIFLTTITPAAITLESPCKSFMPQFLHLDSKEPVSQGSGGVVRSGRQSCEPGLSRFQ